MLNPLDAPNAAAAAVEPLVDLLDDCNHVPFIDLFPVVPATGTAPGHDAMQELAQAVYDAGAGGYRVSTPARPFDSPHAWRDILRREVTEGFLQPAHRYRHSVPDLRTPDEIRRAGELADGVADLIEAHLGPVRSSGDVAGPHMGYLWWRNLLLVTDAWATVLHLGIAD